MSEGWPGSIWELDSPWSAPTHWAGAHSAKPSLSPRAVYAFATPIPGQLPQYCSTRVGTLSDSVPVQGGRDPV